MTRTRHAISSVLLIVACKPAAAPVDNDAAAVRAQDTVDAGVANASGNAATGIGEPEAVGDAAANGNTPLPPLDPPAPGTPGGLADDRTPLSEAPFAPDSAQGAANVVQTYYALIERGEYAHAFALRDATADPGTAAAFAAGFARYGEYHANIGAPGRIEAGAGQRHVRVPVQVYARLKAGATPVYEIGSVTLHRSGDVDGAGATQRTWRIRTIALKPAPAR